MVSGMKKNGEKQRLKPLRELISNVGKNRIEGSSTKQGYLYHELPFFNSLPTHRKSSKLRADLIKSNLIITDKTGLDLGCSVGGITFELQLAGAKMVGIDYDTDAINLAKEVEKYYNTGAIFTYQPITFQLVFGLQQFDFIVWLNQWMWLAKQEGEDIARQILYTASKKTEVLFFSTSENDGQAKLESVKNPKDVYKLLSRTTRFKNIENLGIIKDGKHKRTMFKCY